MSSFVRVKHPLFGEYSVRIPSADVEVIDKPATDRYGRPLPPKPKVSVTTRATDKPKNESVASPTPTQPEEGSE